MLEIINNLDQKCSKTEKHFWILLDTNLSSHPSPTENGHAVHSREVQHLGASSHPTQDRGERQRLRAAVLGDGAVLPEPRLLRVRAAGPPGGHGPGSGRQPAGRARSAREERQEGDQDPQHTALHQGE